MKKEEYEYTTNKELFSDFFKEFEEYLTPFFNSFMISKKTFSFQIVNLVFVFIIFFILLDGFWEKITSGVRGSGVLMMEIFLLMIIVGLSSIFFDSKILKWQTLFKMNRELSKKWLFYLGSAIAGIYALKTHVVNLIKGIFLLKTNYESTDINKK